MRQLGLTVPHRVRCNSRRGFELINAAVVGGLLTVTEAHSRGSLARNDVSAAKTAIKRNTAVDNVMTPL
jgi:hypothetical protein